MVVLRLGEITPVVTEEVHSGDSGSQTEQNLPEIKFNDMIVIARSPINVDHLHHELVFFNHPDRDALWNGFTQGFQLHYTGRSINIKINSQKLFIKNW